MQRNRFCKYIEARRYISLFVQIIRLMNRCNGFIMSAGIVDHVHVDTDVKYFLYLQQFRGSIFLILTARLHRPGRIASWLWVSVECKDWPTPRC